jgi:soluble lytic murein transglycosylase-like protein
MRRTSSLALIRLLILLAFISVLALFFVPFDKSYKSPRDYRIKTQAYTSLPIASERERTPPRLSELEMIIEHIESSAIESGVDPNTALRIANCESSLNPRAKNPHSSATGLYQFTIGTWEWIGSPGERTDYKANTAAFMKYYPKYPQWWVCK